MIRLMFKSITLAAAVVVGAHATCAASDYSIEYAIYADDLSSRGTLDCSSGKRCMKRIDELKLRLEIFLRTRANQAAEVLLSGRAGCCLFHEGSRSAVVYPRGRTKLAIFEGRARKGNEFVLNNAVGTLILEFGEAR
jgi:hypothetical protein